MLEQFGWKGIDVVADLTEKTLATDRKYTGKIISVDLLDIELPMRFERVADGLLVYIPHIFTGTSPIAPVFRMGP